MDKDLINDYRAVVLPVLQNILIKNNFEGRGFSDALEIEKDFNEILRLAAETKAMEADLDPDNYEYNPETGYLERKEITNENERNTEEET